MNRARVIVDFKSQTLPHMVGSIVESAFKAFYMQLSDIADIQSSYNPLIFIEEFVTLEAHYLPLHDNLSFVPFLESLLQRIKAFEKTQDSSVKNKQIFSYLYSAVYSEICTVRSNLNRAVVFNLPEFMKELIGKIRELNEATSKKIVFQQRDKYKEELDKKIASARSVIETEVMPAIETVHDDLDEQINELLEENRRKQEEQHERKKAKEEEMRQMQRNMGLRMAFLPIRIFSSVISLAVPGGAAVGTAVDALTGLAGKLAEGKTSQSEWREYVSPTVLKTIDKIGDNYESKSKLLKKQLDVLKEKITKKLVEHPDSKHLKDVVDKINDLVSYMESKTDLEIGLEDKKIREDLKRFLEKNRKDADVEQNSMFAEGDKEEEKKNSAVGTILEKAKDIIGVVDVTLDQFDAIKNDEEQIKEVADAIESIERDIQALRKHEQIISAVMIPEIQRIRHNITHQNPDEGGGVETIVKNWKLQNSIRDTKFLLEKLTDGFSVQRDLEESFNKILGGMAFLANIYDRIESYSETKTFADFITKVNHAKPDFGDKQLDNAVAKLEAVIKSNIVLELYDVAIHAIKQHYFPFARIFLNRFNLPIDLQMNDTESIKRGAIKQITQLESDIKLSNISTIDEEFANYLQYSGTQTNLTLYTWQAESIKNEVNKLLRGEEIVLSADILRGRNYDAIKFRNIGLYFVARNQSYQQLLDDALKDYIIEMRMIGDGYYRCGSRFYTLSSLDQKLDYSFRKGEDGSPDCQGRFYKTIDANDFFLSPYVMWSYRLRNYHDVKKGFNTLAAFLDLDMDLELVGDVQYLRDFPVEYCNRYVDKYYRLDSTLTV